MSSHNILSLIFPPQTLVNVKAICSSEALQIQGGSRPDWAHRLVDCLLCLALDPVIHKHSGLQCSF